MYSVSNPFALPATWASRRSDRDKPPIGRNPAAAQVFGGEEPSPLTFIAGRCLFVCSRRHEHDCSPVVHACVRVFSRGSRPTSRPTPVISRIFSFSSHDDCLSHKHMAVAVHHVFCALHPLLRRACCCLLLCIPASQPHSPPLRVRGRVGGGHRGGATWQPPCPLCCGVGGTTHRLFISVVHWEGRVTFTVRGSARVRDE